MPTGHLPEQADISTSSRKPRTTFASVNRLDPNERVWLTVHRSDPQTAIVWHYVIKWTDLPAPRCSPLSMQPWLKPPDMIDSPSYDDAATSLVTLSDIEAAAERLKPVINHTPVHTSRTFNEHTDADVYFQCEQFQRTGAFKLRGAFNALSQLPPEQQEKGVLTFSSGNHAQAVALAGTLLEIPTTIVMPKNAPAVKLQATRDYGAEVVEYDPATETREDLANRLSRERDQLLIPPSNHPDIIAGQGTVARQLLETVGPLDALIVGCGGGGLLSGCAVAANGLAPDCRVIGIEPAAGDDAARSFYSGELKTVENPETIAEGARTPSLGSLTFPLIQEYVSEMHTVTDEAIIRTLRFLWERMKLVVEPTGALGATALYDRVVSLPGKRVGIVLSGGNVDLNTACELFER